MQTAGDLHKGAAAIPGRVEQAAATPQVMT
jgi:hypothetical protein